MNTIQLLPEVFKELADEFPLLRPSVRMVPFPSLLGLVENQKLHAAFGTKEGQKKSSLYFRRLCSAPIACVCSPEQQYFAENMQRILLKRKNRFVMIASSTNGFKRKGGKNAQKSKDLSGSSISDRGGG